MLVIDHIPSPGFTPTNGRIPRLRSEKLTVQFRNGYVDRKHSYTIDQIRWGDSGSEWDVVAARRA